MSQGSPRQTRPAIDPRAAEAEVPPAAQHPPEPAPQRPVGGLRLLLRRIRTWVVTAFSLSCIGLALLIGMLSLFLPLLERYPDEVAAWLAARTGLDVEIDAVHGRWEPRGPVLGLSGLRLGEPGSGVLVLEHGELVMDLYAGVLRRGSRSELRLTGLDLDIQRDLQGRLRLAGLGSGAQAKMPGNQWRWLGRIGALRLVDVHLHLTDQRSGTRLELGPGELLLREEAGQLWIDVQLARAGTEGSLQLRAEAKLGPDAAGLPELRRAHLKATQLEVPVWLEGLPLPFELLGGRLSTEAWLDLREHAEMVVDLAFEDLRVARSGPLSLRTASIQPRFFLPQLGMRLRLESPSSGQWQLAVESATYQRLGREVVPGALEFVRGEAEQLILHVADLPLEDFAGVLLLAPLPLPLAEWLHESVPRGQLSRFVIERDADGRWLGEFALQAIDWLPLRDLPGAQGVSVDGRFDTQALVARLSAPEGLTVDTGGLFRAPLGFEHASGHLVAGWSRDGDWIARIEELELQAEGAAIELEGAIWPEQGRPRLDLHARVLEGSVEVAKRYWPTRIMPAETVNWLDEHLVSGQLVSGRASFTGRPADWPFDGTALGRFEALAEVVDADLRFHDRWGGGREVHALARFFDNSMHIQALAGKVDGQAVDRAEARIEDFREPILELDLSTAAEAGQTLSWLRRTPVQARAGAFLFGLALEGPIALSTQIRIPLKRSLGRDSVRGQVELLGVDLFDVKWGLRLKRSHGRLSFSEDGLRAEGLRGLSDGEPLVLDLAFGTACSDPRRAAEVSLRGPMAAEDLIALRPELEWLQGRIPGVAHWELDFALDAEGAPAGSGWQLALNSDLLGVAVDLPEPLRKPPSEPRRLSLQLARAADRLDLALGFSELLALAARWSDAGQPEFALALGEGRIEASGSAGMRAFGRLDELQLVGWPLPIGGGGLLPDGLDFDVKVDQLRLGASELGAVQVSSTRPSAAGGLELALSGPAVAGALRAPVVDDPAWSLQLQRLHWPLPEPSTDLEPGHGAPLRPLTRMLPAQGPALRVEVAELQLGEQPLGRLRLEAAPRGEEWRIEELSLHSPRLALDASGDWRRRPGGSGSRFSARLGASDPGGLLRGLGYAVGLEGGQATLVLNASWPGGPQDFALRRLLGELDLEIEGGRVRDVQPGAGRLLGLFSLTEIPRRLSLDFGDFFQQGLAINSIRGRFHLEAGAAFTDSLVVLSPAAEVHVRGRTGLVTRDYDQEMLVLPAVGAGLPLVGALTAGPAGAAAGWLMQGMLNDPLSRAAAQRYRITGSWSEPRVDLLERPRRTGAARP